MIQRATVSTWVYPLTEIEIDSIVIEYCKHGTVMDIGLSQRAKPYSHEEARNLFRDLVLGIEYRIHPAKRHTDFKSTRKGLCIEILSPTICYLIHMMCSKSSILVFRKCSPRKMID